MSYIVPRDIPKTCGECPCSRYSEERQSLMCGIDDNILCVKPDVRYRFCELIEVRGTLFDKEKAKRYLGVNLPTSVPTVREVTE